MLVTKKQRPYCVLLSDALAAPLAFCTTLLSGCCFWGQFARVEVDKCVKVRCTNTQEWITWLEEKHSHCKTTQVVTKLLNVSHLDTVLQLALICFFNAEDLWVVGAQIWLSPSCTERCTVPKVRWRSIMAHLENGMWWRGSCKIRPLVAALHHLNDSILYLVPPAASFNVLWGLLRFITTDGKSNGGIRKHGPPGTCTTSFNFNTPICFVLTTTSGLRMRHLQKWQMHCKLFFFFFNLRESKPGIGFPMKATCSCCCCCLCVSWPGQMYVRWHKAAVAFSEWISNQNMT